MANLRSNEYSIAKRPNATSGTEKLIQKRSQNVPLLTPKLQHLPMGHPLPAPCVEKSYGDIISKYQIERVLAARRQILYAYISYDAIYY